MSRDEEEVSLPGESTVELGIRSFEDVEDAADPRLSRDDRPDVVVLDENFAHQLSDIVHHKDHRLRRSKDISDLEKHTTDLTPESDEPLYIDFEKGDKRDPINYSYRRKWVITLTASFFGFVVACAASAYSLGYPSMIRDLNCTQFQASIGLALYALGFGIVPLVTASFSEEFGRQPLYLSSGLGFVLMSIMLAESKNIQTVLIGRFFSGAFGSTGSTMVGGTVADLWLPKERGFAMAMFATSAVGATGIGSVIGGWVEQNPHMQWRWIEWINAILGGVFTVAVPLLMKETRSSVILVRLAKKMRKDTGNHRYRARIEDERASLITLIRVSCTRPIYLLVSEPVIASFSLWIGFVWGILYAMIDSVAPIFQTLHGFNAGLTGTVFVTFMIGSILGVIGNFFQERLYQKNVGTRGPEARLYAPIVAAFILPAGLFVYAWTAYAKLYWIAPAIGIVLIMWALWIIYLAVFTYIADCYGPFASSALAGQSLFRNLMGMAFPLFTAQMYAKLGYHWANTLFALIAVVMIPIPLVLFFKGPVLRARSKFASQVVH